MAFSLEEWKRALAAGVKRVLGDRNVVVGGSAHDSALVPGSHNAVAHGTDATAIQVQGDLIVTMDPALLASRLGRSRKLTPDQQQHVLGRYLHFVVDSYRYLDFKGMGVSDRAPVQLPLAEMYVPLSARVELPAGETWDREELQLAGRALSDEERAALGGRPGASAPILDLLRRHDGLIVLGDPGAGKTTLLKFLALQLATGHDAELGLGSRLPVLVPLAAYSTALASGDLPLDVFIGTYFAARGIDLHVEVLLREALERGAALVLLDGLDEVKDAHKRDLTIRCVVDFFRIHRHAGNKFVITSRIVGYHDVRTPTDGLGECMLVDFDLPEIETFVGKWTAAFERVAQGATPGAARAAQREKEELLDAVRHNAAVRRLAANPLLLTILALMKRQGISLPERRVELYKQYVEVLLSHWNRGRSLDGRPARDVDVLATLRVLAPLALAMHQASPGVGLLARERVLSELATIYAARGETDPEAAALRLLNDVRADSGLLVSRGPGQYGFIHLTFQEYLAAVALARQVQRGVDAVVQALAQHVADATWREVSLLVIGVLGIVQGHDETASEVVSRLLHDQPGEPGQAVVLCGDAVADAWPGGVTPACRESVRTALLATMGDARVSAIMRATAGDTLARVGDPRFRTDAWLLPNEPLLGFVEIPAGSFVMGEGTEARTETLPAYFIGRFPVTVAQFRAFVDEGGQVADHDSVREPATRPVRWVRWSEALAYTEWLTDKLRTWDETPGPLARLLQGTVDGRRWRVTLPSEAEWKRAAGGTDGRLYPWGDEAPDVSRANFHATRIGHPSPVGCFPAGATRDGIHELSGNVWEWTRSLYEDGGDDSTGSDNTHHAARGGAFDVEAGCVRAAVRVPDWPGSRHYGIGFRVVVSPF